MKRFFNIEIACVIAGSAMAVPAYRGPIVRTMADGSEKTIYLHGDAWDHHMTDEQGQWLDEKSLLPLTEAQQAARQQSNAARRKARRVQQEKQEVGKLNLAPRGILIMVNFANKAFATPRDTIDSMLNAEHFTRKYTIQELFRPTTIKSEGSARKYFQDQSYGQYNPHFDVVGPYTLAHDYSYYGLNDDANAGEMIKEACLLANQDGADFTQYDNDNDGYVDFVYVLYAGYGQADSGIDSVVWPHNYNLSYHYINCRVDGKTVDNYACSNEINYKSNLYNGIGTFCHEFSHVLGFPDLYETNSEYNYKGLHTLLDWDILDYGCYNNQSNTPSGYSAYERFCMGWLTPRVLTDPEYVTLHPIHEGEGESLLLCEGDSHNLNGFNPDPSVFYLLECRKKTGWDAYLPGKGMLITKIQYSWWRWQNNQVNNNSSHFGVDILEARTNTGSSSRTTDAFPAGATQWTAFADHEITNISLDSEGVIRFSYRGEPDPTEGMEEVMGDRLQVTGKILRNGQIVIIRGDKEYDLVGREL